MAGRVIVKTENTKIPSQLTFSKQGRHEAQKSEQHQPQGGPQGVNNPQFLWKKLW